MIFRQALPLGSHHPQVAESRAIALLVPVIAFHDYSLVQNLY